MEFRGRFLMMVSALGLVSLAHPALAADPMQLVANAHASAVGGCNGCGHAQDQTTSILPSLTSSAADTSFGGASFADAWVKSQYGTQRAYADAFLAAGDTSPDAQSNAFSRFIDYFSAGTFATTANFTFAITGSHTPSDDIVGPAADAELHWSFIDVTTNTVIGFGNWSSTDAPPPTLTASYVVPLGHVTSLLVDFSVSAYAAQRADPFLVYADFKHTVRTYIDAGAGQDDVIGQSGHNYTVTSVPEPAAWAMLMLGFGAVGVAVRRRARVLPA